MPDPANNHSANSNNKRVVLFVTSSFMAGAILPRALPQIYAWHILPGFWILLMLVLNLLAFLGIQRNGLRALQIFALFSAALVALSLPIPSALVVVALGATANTCGAITVVRERSFWAVTCGFWAIATYVYSVYIFNVLNIENSMSFFGPKAIA
jgi:hypothetical protein